MQEHKELNERKNTSNKAVKYFWENALFHCHMSPRKTNTHTHIQCECGMVQERRKWLYGQFVHHDLLYNHEIKSRPLSLHSLTTDYYLTVWMLLAFFRFCHSSIIHSFSYPFLLTLTDVCHSVVLSEYEEDWELCYFMVNKGDSTQTATKDKTFCFTLNPWKCWATSVIITSQQRSKKNHMLDKSEGWGEANGIMWPSWDQSPDQGQVWWKWIPRGYEIFVRPLQLPAGKVKRSTNGAVLSCLVTITAAEVYTAIKCTPCFIQPQL